MNTRTGHNTIIDRLLWHDRQERLVTTQGKQRVWREQLSVGLDSPHIVDRHGRRAQCL